MVGFGREEKHIDWELVDAMLLSGCIGTEIAPFFNMHPQTFYDRVVKKYGVSFTEYCCALHAKGEAHLKHKQFKKAMDGDTKMLMYLGEVRLKQRRAGIEAGVDSKTHANHEALMSQLSALQEDSQSARKKERSISSSE